MAASPHAWAPQVTSQRHAWSQVTPLSQLIGPLQATSHGPAPQITSFAHESVPEHCTAHDVAMLQSIPPAQLPIALQRTSHGSPAGQTTTVGQPSSVPQVITHTPS